MTYIPALDGIRAFAVLLVMLTHTHVPHFVAGYWGVDVFFVLSGFIITTLLLHEIKDKGRIGYLHFYIRRILRLYPALLLLLLLVLLGFWACTGKPPWEMTRYYGHALIAALYMSDVALLLGFMPLTSILMHTWSLAIEEHYYILWPWLLARLRRKWPGIRLSHGLAGGYAAALLWAIGNSFFVSSEAAYLRFDLHISGIVLGGWLAAYLFDGGKIPQHHIALAAAFTLFMACLLCAPTAAFPYGRFCLTVVEVFTALLIYTLMQEREGRLAKFLGSLVPAYLGRISYGIYLFHYPIAVYLRIDRDWTIVFPMTAVLSVAIASTSYYLLERPALKAAKKYRHVAGGKPL